MKTKKKFSSKQKREMRTAYAMLLPDVFGLLVFVFVPIVYAFYISLHSWTGLSDMVFIGLGNYIKMMKDRMFHNSVIVTIKYTLMYVPSIFVLALLLACLLSALNEKPNPPAMLGRIG